MNTAVKLCNNTVSLYLLILQCAQYNGIKVDEQNETKDIERFIFKVNFHILTCTFKFCGLGLCTVTLFVTFIT